MATINSDNSHNEMTGNDKSLPNFIFKFDIIPTSNIMTQNCSPLKENEGQRMEKRLKVRTSRDWTKEMQNLYQPFD